jgi:hypothetical protein
MSISTFHANFKAIISNPPLRYLQTLRLRKAQVLMVAAPMWPRARGASAMKALHNSTANLTAL